MNKHSYQRPACLLDRLSNSRVRLIPLALCLARPAVSPAATPDAGQIYNEQQQVQPRPMERRPEAEQKPEPLAAPKAGEVKVHIRSIRFSGWENVATEAELQAQVADALGKEWSYAGLQQLANRITRFLQSKGFPLVKAYLPKQEIAEGTLEIAIRIGTVEGSRDGAGIEMKADHGTRLDSAIVRGTVARALFAGGAGGAIKTENLERGLLLLNDMPGIAARAALERGSKPGESKLEVSVNEGPLLSGGVSEDNFGSRYTGKWRTGFEANLNDPLGRGDQLAGRFVHAANLDLTNLSYRLPLGLDGWTISANFSNLDYQILQSEQSFGEQGTVRTAGLNLAYPLRRALGFSLWSSIDYRFKWLQDRASEQTLQQRVLNIATASLFGQYRDNWWWGANGNFGVSLSGGDLDLSANSGDLTNDSHGPRSQGAYVKANYQFARLQRLGERLSLYWSFQGQLAGSNLNSSEKFILGGPNGIRAYPLGEGFGDTGWLTNVELRYDLPPAFDFNNLQLIGFFDTGRITEHETNWPNGNSNFGQTNRYGLSGAGLGFNASYGKHLDLIGSVATAVGGNAGRDPYNNNGDGRRDNTQFWLQAALSF